MAEALESARDDRHPPKELLLLQRIDRFGVEAVLGRRTLYHGEMNAMIAAENVYQAYKSRAQSDNWAEWAKKNEAAARLLQEVETWQTPE